MVALGALIGSIGAIIVGANTESALAPTLVCIICFLIGMACDPVMREVNDIEVHYNKKEIERKRRKEKLSHEKWLEYTTYVKNKKR